MRWKLDFRRNAKDRYIYRVKPLDIFEKYIYKAQPLDIFAEYIHRIYKMKIFIFIVSLIVLLAILTMVFVVRIRNTDTDMETPNLTVGNGTFLAPCRPARSNCLQMFVCDPVTATCKFPQDGPCATSADCISGLQCVSGKCT